MRGSREKIGEGTDSLAAARLHSLSRSASVWPRYILIRAVAEYKGDR